MGMCSPGTAFLMEFNRESITYAYIGILVIGMNEENH